MEPKEQIKAIEEKALADLNNVKDLEGLTNFRNTYLAKKSELSSLMGKMKEIPAEERGAFGKAVNDEQERVCAFDMLQELVTETLAFAGAFQETRNVCDHEAVTVHLHDAEHRFKRRKRIIGDLRLSPCKNRKQR